MRIRHLQTYLTDQNLIRYDNLSDLKSFRVAIDAVYWSRTLPGMKDPFADALGGLPLALTAVVDKEIQLLRDSGIEPVFIFQGMQPRSHHLFSSKMNQQRDEGWSLLVKGDRQGAQAKFTASSSRVNSDFIHYLFHYLQSTKNCECFQAPYLAASQIAYFAENSMFDAVYGPPSLMLFGIPKVVLGIDFEKGKYEWVDMNQMLKAWCITRDQFIDACLMAGTEYCLTFPYLNLHQFHPNQATFTFGTAVEFIQQAPLLSYMQHFPNDEMRNDHLDGYCMCRALIQHPLILSLNGSVIPLVTKGPLSLADEGSLDTLNASHANAYAGGPHAATVGHGANLPFDFSSIVGVRLPQPVYFLMARGVLSRRLPSVLATGEWRDFSYPTVDSSEYRDLQNDLRDYRCRAVGLVAQRLPSYFRKRQIKFVRNASASVPGNGHVQFMSAHCPPETPLGTKLPDCSQGLGWKISKEAVKAEMERQGVKNVDFLFCLRWASAEADNQEGLLKDVAARGSAAPKDIGSLLCHVYFLILEALGYFTEEGGMTVFGSALMSSSPSLQEHTLVLLELMRFGCLSGDALEAVKSKPFPEGSTAAVGSQTKAQRSVLLISRIMSLLPMKLRDDDMWDSEVDFDLAAFHALVTILKRTLRLLTEGALASLLLPDVASVRLLPNSIMDPTRTFGVHPTESTAANSTVSPPLTMSPKSKTQAKEGGSASGKGSPDHDKEKSPSGLQDGSPSSLAGAGAGGEDCGFLPMFLLPGNAMGIVTKFFLEYVPSPLHSRDQFEERVREAFPSCEDPIGDLLRGIGFWEEIYETIMVMDQSIDVSDLRNDMIAANEFLKTQREKIGL